MNINSEVGLSDLTKDTKILLLSRISVSNHVSSSLSDGWTRDYSTLLATRNPYCLFHIADSNNNFYLEAFPLVNQTTFSHYFEVICGLDFTRLAKSVTIFALTLLHLKQMQGIYNNNFHCFSALC